MSATQEYVDAFSTVSPDGVPRFGNCELIVGDGTQKITFTNGRAKVPVGIAHLVAKHPNVEIPALGLVPENAALPTTGPQAATGVNVQIDPQAELVASQAARIRELEATLKNADLKAQSSGAPQDLEIADSDTKPADVDEKLDAAREYLQEEGEDVPEPEPKVREGFEATTSDGAPRCQASKGDGSQCANTARDGDACHLAPHQAQLT